MRDFFWGGGLYFLLGFWGKWGVGCGVFWTECGGLGGEGGLLEDSILVGNFLQFLGIYFWDFHLADEGTRVASLPLKRQIQGFFASLRMTTQNKQQQQQRQRQKQIPTG